jgi:hypothetical protein
LKEGRNLLVFNVGQSVRLHGGYGTSAFALSGKVEGTQVRRDLWVPDDGIEDNQPRYIMVHLDTGSHHYAYASQIELERTQEDV